MENQTRFENLIKELEDLFGIRPSDLTTYRSRNIHLVTSIMKKLRLKISWFNHLFKTHSYVHPNIAETLMNGDEEVETLLAQGLVRNDKLLKILKNGLHDEILAVDGLSGNLYNGPNFDYKHYLQNLKHESPQSHYDEDPKYRRKHCLLVRDMYKELKNVTNEPAKHVYSILRGIFKEVMDVELPPVKDMTETLPADVESRCTMTYLGRLTKKEVEDIFKNIKLRNEKKNEEEPAAKVAKVEQ